MRLKKSARPKLPTVAAVAVVVAVSTAPVHSSEAMFENAVAKASWNVAVTNAELHKLERHVRRDPDGRQVLNKGAAEASGSASASTLSLADEIVRYQNEAHARMLEARVANLLHVKIDLNNYPLLRSFFDSATAEAVRRMREGRRVVPKAYVTQGGVDVTEVDPCGDYDHPVPDRSPEKIVAPLEPTLESMGYHRTAGYACGASNLISSCPQDYTRERSYKGTYGTCDSPRFRDQGVHRPKLHPNNNLIQMGEPNPEVHSYIWPYWNWPTYVSWWHERY